MLSAFINEVAAHTGKTLVLLQALRKDRGPAQKGPGRVAGQRNASSAASAVR